MLELFRLHRGDGPVLVNVPHAGTHVPEDIRARLTAAAADLPDTDWFVDELYGFAPGLGAGLMVATHSRYVVDLNRPPDNSALYATRGTGLLPLETFSEEPVYAAGQAPDDVETGRRLEAYWRPYHETLDAELTAIRERHGFAILLDGHSILSRVPALFEGRLPDLNLGSYGGRSAAPGLVQSAMSTLASEAGRTLVLDGRFKGGYITRHYGQPARGQHALQLEMAQSLYMRESPPTRSSGAMRDLGEALSRLVSTLLDWRP